MTELNYFFLNFSSMTYLKCIIILVTSKYVFSQISYTMMWPCLELQISGGLSIGSSRMPLAAQSSPPSCFQSSCHQACFWCFIKGQDSSNCKICIRVESETKISWRPPVEYVTNDGRHRNVHSNMAAARGKQILSSKNANFNLKRNLSFSQARSPALPQNFQNNMLKSMDSYALETDSE